VKATITVYHGSTENLAIIAKGSCVAATPDLPSCYGRGQVPSSKGYGQRSGWIYEMEVMPAQLERVGVDWLLSEDITPTKQIPAESHKPKSAKELLEGKPF
jgi:hypothetical protein